MNFKNIFRYIKLIPLSFQCPRFYEDMPKKDRVGKWEVGCIVYSHWHRMEKDVQIFEGSLIEAYIKARKIALKEDHRTRDVGELGVQWFVKNLEFTEPR